MAVYKVPQDVEADDKLLGPFSFRQFIYLIVALMGIVLGWGLAQIFIVLAVLPLPIIILFGALALPLKKDQPMETYLAAVLSFHLKPRVRVWQADGVQSLVEIVAPKVVEEHLTKELSEDETERRLSYLANLVDSRGWAVRGVDLSQSESPMKEDVFLEAQRTEDMLDDTSPIINTFDNMIGKADAKRRQDAINMMNQPSQQVTIPPISDPYTALGSSSQPGTNPAATQVSAPETISFNPYPHAMRQSVIYPEAQAPAQSANAQPTPATPQQPQPVQRIQQQEPAQDTSNTTVSPDIISLVNNSTGLSVETIAHEAERIRKKEEQSSSDEVVISLR
jgi:hypothetical protein